MTLEIDYNLLFSGLGTIVAMLALIYGFIRNLKLDLTVQIEKMGKNIETRMDRIETRMDKFEERLTRLENDMIEVKTILRLKECCMIKDDRQMKKVE